MEDQTPPAICKICGSDKLLPLFEAQDRLSSPAKEFPVARCPSCEVWSTLPDMSESEIGEYYPVDYWGTEPTQEWVMRSQTAKLDLLKAFGLHSGRILDVGCGSGFFLRALEPDKWNRYGVETGTEAVNAARKHLSSDRIYEGQISSLAPTVGLFDVITLWSCLEHMNEPVRELAAVRNHLKPNGAIIIQVPNAGSYQARFFKNDWFALDVPRHRHHFCLPALRSILAPYDLEIIAATTVSREHNLHSLRQSLKSRLRRWGNLHKGIYLLVKPFTWPFDRIMSQLGKGATITVVVKTHDSIAHD